MEVKLGSRRVWILNIVKSLKVYRSEGMIEPSELVPIDNLSTVANKWLILHILKQLATDGDSLVQLHGRHNWLSWNTLSSIAETINAINNPLEGTLQGYFHHYSYVGFLISLYRPLSQCIIHDHCIWIWVMFASRWLSTTPHCGIETLLSGCECYIQTLWLVFRMVNNGFVVDCRNFACDKPGWRF